MEVEKISELDSLATADNSDILVINDVSEGDTMKITKQNLLKEVNQTLSNLTNLIYPVGAIYISTSSTSPATLFGGTWVQLKDKFLLSAGDTYTAGNTGGEATHTLTIEEMPAHTHTGQRHYQSTSSSTGYSGNWTSQKYTTDNTGSTGGGQAHNNMPPYLVVYVWERTA